MSTTTEPVHPGIAAPAVAPPTTGRRHKRRFLIWIVILLAFAGLFWWVEARGRGSQPHRPMAAPVSVTIATAKQGELHVYLDAIGTVTPVYTDLITSQVSGQVVAVHYTEGQLVKRGAPLIDIDPRPFQATLLQAQGTLEHDTEVLAQAKMDLERFRAAWAKNAIAKQQLDDQEKLVLQTAGTVKNDRGTVQFDEVQLGFCHLTAPITGRVGLRLVDPGNVVTATGATTLAVITQLQPISVVFTVSEDHLGDVVGQAGDQLPVDAYDRVRTKKLASGKLITIDNQVDTTTGTVKLRALFDNRDDALFPNQFVNTKLLVKTLDQVTLVPSSAIQHDGNVAFVYSLGGIGNQRVTVQHITVGMTEGDTTAVQGIAAGTVVANSSFDKLSDGAHVTIAEQATGSAGSAGP